MVTKAIGGGSSAVASSSHAACARFRGTDPLITGRSRRALANDVGYRDDFGGIPAARWMRATTFERLVRDERFASEVATTAVGRLGLERPEAIVIANAHSRVDVTAELLAKAHDRAAATGTATMLHDLAVPFVGFEDERATDVKPDFAVVTRRREESSDRAGGSWLVVGDAKDYERVRSRIDDQRLLKGFLQVAVGAESAAAWSKLPDGMAVHGHGVLAVPRNSFLQPEALVEDIGDHRAEVIMRMDERRREASDTRYDPDSPLEAHVRHLVATFDPAACTSCTLFAFCRDELRRSGDLSDLLVEIGVSRNERPLVLDWLDDPDGPTRASASTMARVAATRDGVPRPTGQARIDQAGTPGSVNVVIAKSDSAALGVYGISVQRVTADGPGEWRSTVFDDPQGARTRRAVMRTLGRELVAVMKDRRIANPTAPEPVHLVVPDRATADVLTSIADNLAGVELSRLRWARDVEMGRTPLTFAGEVAELPPALPETDRTAVSFLLEEDRARTFTLRSPIVDVSSALGRLLTPGGPEVAALRLDYLLAWAEASDATPLRHRDVADAVEREEHTPGARLTNRRSDAIHEAFVGRSRTTTRPAEPATYERLVMDELAYKSDVLERAVTALSGYPDSALREVHRAIEGDAQEVWRRRLSLHASDLVRFGRTYRHWRNSLVPAVETDADCAAKLLSLGNPQAALDSARDTGTRQVAAAEVVAVDPLVLRIDSRRIGDESRVVLLHVGDESCVETGDVDIAHQRGSFKLTGLSLGPLEAVDSEERQFVWRPGAEPELAVGNHLVVADVSWFSDLKNNRDLKVDRPQPDAIAAPRPTCSHESYEQDPEAHQYCCRSHEVAEAAWSDELAQRRARGELNPQAWPPVVDSDAFEVSPQGAAAGDPTAGAFTSAPDDVTADDLD